MHYFCQIFFFFPVYGGPETVWLPRFFKMSSVLYINTEAIKMMKEQIWNYVVNIFFFYNLEYVLFLII